MKRFKVSLAVLALLFAVASAFTSKTTTLYYGVTNGTGGRTGSFTTEPDPAIHCLTTSSNICIVKKVDGGAEQTVALNGFYQ
ncbi:MAG TPA: DUF6520 family protein [Puia sp.]